MSVKTVCLIVAVVLFAIEAVWHKNIIAAGLAFFAAAFLF
jgi:hypothetical protein